MKISAIIERGTDGTYDVRTNNAHLKYMILGQGETVQEAINDFYNTYDEIKQTHADLGKDFAEVESFEFRYDIPSFLQHYSVYFSYAALSRLTGINETQLSQYVQGYRKPGKKTAEKIKKKLHELGKELQQLQFV